MMAETAEGNFTGAAKIFRKTVPFPGIVSRSAISPADPCANGRSREPLAVAAIEKACLDCAAELHEKNRRSSKKRQTRRHSGRRIQRPDRRFDLAKKGYAVVVREGRHLGGSLWRFPEEKLPRDIIARGLQILEKVGVNIRLNTNAGKDISLMRFPEILTPFTLLPAESFQMFSVLRLTPEAG